MEEKTKDIIGRIIFGILILYVGITIGIYGYKFYISENPPIIPSPSNHFNQELISGMSSFLSNNSDYRLYSDGNTDTHSMLPILNKDTSIILYLNFTEEDIQIGDIIIYEIPIGTNSVRGYMHRVVEINEINQTFFYIARGDNLQVDDFWNIKYDEIFGVVVGVLY